MCIVGLKLHNWNIDKPAYIHNRIQVHLEKAYKVRCRPFFDQRNMVFRSSELYLVPLWSGALKGSKYYTISIIYKKHFGSKYRYKLLHNRHNKPEFLIIKNLDLFWWQLKCRNRPFPWISSELLQFLVKQHSSTLSLKWKLTCAYSRKSLLNFLQGSIKIILISHLIFP